MRTRVRFRVWELNWRWKADGFDARSRRPAWLKNLLAGLQSGRLFDGVRTGSQQPAALRLRTFNSRLVRGATPPPFICITQYQETLKSLLVNSFGAFLLYLFVSSRFLKYSNKQG